MLKPHQDTVPIIAQSGRRSLRQARWMPADKSPGAVVSRRISRAKRRFDSGKIKAEQVTLNGETVRLNGAPKNPDGTLSKECKIH